jgi:hypothetical protein
MFYNTLNSGACSLLQIRRFGPATRVTYHPFLCPLKIFVTVWFQAASLARVLSKGETARLVGAVLLPILRIKAMSSPTSIPSSSSSSRKGTKKDDDDDDDDFDSGDLESDYSSDDSEHQRHIDETHSEAQLKRAEEVKFLFQRVRAASVPHLLTLALTRKDKDASTTMKKKKKKMNKAPSYYTIDEVVTEVMSSLKAASTTNNTTTKKRVSSKKQHTTTTTATNTTKTTTTKAASPTMSSLDIPPSVSKQKTLPVKWQKLRASFKFVRSVGFFFLNIACFLPVN